MAAVTAGTIGIIGLGAVGGSVAKALARTGWAVRAYAHSAADRDAARRAGIDVRGGIVDCVNGAGAALIAVPMTQHVAVAGAVADAAAAGTILLHAASLQAHPALEAAGVRGSRYAPEVAQRTIGTHPLAGSHRTGFGAADADLFAGCVVSVEERASTAERAVAEAVWRDAGAARFEYRTAAEHDELMAWVSHLPQLASTALAHTIASSGLGASSLGPGGRDATRLAASSFDVWAGILAGGRPAAARVAAAFERSVAALRAALEAGDMQAVAEVWQSAREWRDTARTGDERPVVSARP